MHSSSVSRELALLVLGQISDGDNKDCENISFQILINKALETLLQHWRESLDGCAHQLESAQQNLLDSELKDVDKSSIDRVREHLKICLTDAENVLNGMSASLELPRLLALSNVQEIQNAAIDRVKLVVNKRISIDNSLNKVMEGWRLHRLPRIDRDILRLAVVDLIDLNTPAAVACNEAVDLANRYSDLQGRRMINGVLRRFQLITYPDLS